LQLGGSTTMANRQRCERDDTGEPEGTLGRRRIGKRDADYGRRLGCKGPDDRRRRSDLEGCWRSI
jgi:hypothetical protein